MKISSVLDCHPLTASPGSSYVPQGPCESPISASISLASVPPRSQIWSITSTGARNAPRAARFPVPARRSPLLRGCFIDAQLSACVDASAAYPVHDKRRLYLHAVPGGSPCAQRGLPGRFRVRRFHGCHQHATPRDIQRVEDYLTERNR